MLRKKVGLLVAAAPLLLVGMMAGLKATYAAVPESQDPIKLALHEWTGQHISSYIAGEVLKKMGYNVEYVTAAYLPSATGLSDGNLTGSLEVWDNNLGEFFPKLMQEGKVENIGDLGLDAGEGWLYPKHVESMCPGLPAWEAFLNCADKFATAETLPNGRFLEYPADWGDRAAQLIKGEGLPFEPVPAGSEGALVAELKSAVQKKSPLVMMFWAPHWALSTTQTGWVSIPQDLLKKYSLEKPKVFKAVWPGTKSKWPVAYNFMKAFKVSNEIQEPLMDLVDNQGQDALTVTKKWVEDNQSHWQPMVDKAKMAN
ncbi:MAG: ABC transporter substrate-binding protein [Gammaproteobacteria bacterium]|nr:ABC transporter substrate-binding protein [Gammaproteobacteria bacterium]